MKELEDFTIISSSSLISKSSTYAEIVSAFNADKENLRLFFAKLLDCISENDLSYTPKSDQIFISHTQKDKKYCDSFDRIVARVGIKAFRSEFENVPIHPWKIIREEMRRSTAVSNKSFIV